MSRTETVLLILVAIVVLFAGYVFYNNYKNGTTTGVIQTAKNLLGIGTSVATTATKSIFGVGTTVISSTGSVVESAVGTTTGVAKSVVSGTVDVVDSAMPWNW